MREDKDRPCIRVGRTLVHIDELAYASMSANIDKATKCLFAKDINIVYDKEGWTMLLLHYIWQLQVMVEAFPESIKSIPIERYNKLVGLRTFAELEVYIGKPYHILPLSNDMQILEYVIYAAQCLQIIMRENVKLNQSRIERYYRDLLEDK